MADSKLKNEPNLCMHQMLAGSNKGDNNLQVEVMHGRHFFWKILGPTLDYGQPVQVPNRKEFAQTMLEHQNNNYQHAPTFVIIEKLILSVVTDSITRSLQQ
jgi:hypothetical protein